ncbi:hypothetical protein Bbelb_253730 [Branchiostoma belcheri]|nr:hypothetical protein Bbelb_253730 [Branchiostoma belcheri]
MSLQAAAQAPVQYYEVTCADLCFNCSDEAESAGPTADTFHDSTAILMDGDIRWVIRRGHRPMMLEWQKRNAENSSNVSRVTLGQRAELSVRTTALCVMGGAKERPAGS